MGDRRERFRKQLAVCRWIINNNKVCEQTVGLLFGNPNHSNRMMRKSITMIFGV